jgi:hypothetical protein
MAGIELADATAILNEYKTALSLVLRGQSYTVLGRTLVRADLADIERNIDKWNKKVCQITNGNKLTVCRVIPRIE